MGLRIGLSAICVWLVAFACDWLAYAGGVYWKFWFEIKISASVFLVVLPLVFIRSRFIRIDEISGLAFQLNKLRVVKMQIRFWSVAALSGIVMGWHFSRKEEVWDNSELLLPTFMSSVFFALFYLSLLFLYHFIIVLRVENQPN